MSAIAFPNPAPILRGTGRSESSSLRTPVFRATRNSWPPDGGARDPALYRYRCEGCAACIPIRLRGDRLARGDRAKRLARRNADVTFRLLAPSFSDERFALYAAYVRGRHGASEGNLEESFRALIDSPMAALSEYRDAGGKLLALGFLDVLPQRAFLRLFSLRSGRLQPQPRNLLGLRRERCRLRFRKNPIIIWDSGCPAPPPWTTRRASIPSSWPCATSPNLAWMKRRTAPPSFRRQLLVGLNLPTESRRCARFPSRRVVDQQIPIMIPLLAIFFEVYIQKEYYGIADQTAPKAPSRRKHPRKTPHPSAALKTPSSTSARSSSW